MGESREQVEKEVRESFELAYKERLLTMKNFYEMRFQTLQDTLASSYRRVLQDEIMTTMLRDTTTVNYLEERVKQLFKEIIENQREVLIQKIGLQYSQLKFHYQELEKKHQALRKECDSSLQRNFKDKISSETERSEIAQHFRKKDQQVFELKLELKEKSVLAKEKQRIEEDLKTKLNELKEQNIFLKNRLEKFEDEVSEAIGVQKTKFELKEVDLQESKKKLSMLQEKLKEIEKENEQKLDFTEKKYRKKIGEYKNKIEQYKAKILQLINERREESGKGKEERVQQLQKRINLVNREAERKVSQLKSQREKERMQMERKYEAKNKELQLFYSKLMEEKIEECEKSAMEAVNKIKAEEDEIRKYITFLEENSAPIHEYQQATRLCEMLKQHLETKILENQKMVCNFDIENNSLKSELESTQKARKQMDSQIQNLNIALTESSKNLKHCEQQLNNLRSGEKKSRLAINQLEAEIMEKNDLITTLRNQVQKIRSENSEHMGAISERENLYLQRCQQAEQLEKRVQKATNQAQLLQDELHQSQQGLHSMKKTLSEKQHQIQTMSHDYQFKIEALNSQIKKGSLILENCSERVKELSLRCENTEASLNESNRMRAETEALLRKAQLENKFISESEEAFRKQHESYVADFKRKLQERDDVIQQLQSQATQFKRQNGQIHETLNAKIRKLTVLLAKVQRSYSSQMDKLSRSLKDIKVFVESAQKFFKTEIAMIEHNALIRIREELLTLASAKSDEIRKIKQTLEHEKNQNIDFSKAKTLQIQSKWKEKMDIEIKKYIGELATKQKEIDRLEKDKKKLTIEKQELSEENRNGEKKSKDLQTLFQNEKIQAKAKVAEALRSFDSQRSKIVQQYNAKRDKQQAQFEELVKTMRVLKKQLQDLKCQNQDQKSKFSIEEGSFKKRQRELQKDLEKRRLEVQSLSEQLKETRSSYNRLDGELRQVAEKHNLMIQNSAQSQMRNYQLAGELAVVKARADRLQEQNEDMRRQLIQKQSDRVALEQSKTKVQAELKQLRSAVGKSNKNSELRALQQLDMETKELSSKVNQLRKVNLLMSQDRTPLRS